MTTGLNRCTFIGYVGADPEMKYTANGSAVTTFRIGVTRGWNDDGGGRKEETEWVSIVTWNKLAESLGQHLRKGRQVYVDGRLSSRSWDGPDGQKRYRTEIVATQVLFLGPASRSGSGPGGGGGDIDPDDLPFE